MIYEEAESQRKRPANERKFDKQEHLSSCEQQSTWHITRAPIKGAVICQRKIVQLPQHTETVDEQF